MKYVVGYWVLLVSIVSGCSSTEIGDSKDVAQDKIFQQYSIGHTEGEKSVELLARFRFAGEDGTTLVLTPPSKVEFNGESIKVDSTEMEGAFYKQAKPTNEVYGKYRFVFTDINNKKFENEYTVDTFALINLPASISKNKPFQLQFKSSYIYYYDHIEVNAIDTDSAFTINYVGTDTSSVITIPQSDLIRQKGKVLSLQATIYRRIPLIQQTTEGGYINLKHTIKPIYIRLQ